MAASGILLVVLALCCCFCEQAKAQAVPAQFVFGDSLVDPGNNNFLRTSLAKANYLYNGIDFQGGPSGRFCNGRTVVDVMSELTGLPYSPPYLDPNTKGAAILKGVSYASGAGGILDSTGFNYIERIGMNQQVTFFKNTVSQLNAQLGPAGATDLLSKSLFTIVLGSNDFINNYLLSASRIRFQYTPRQYNVLLLDTLSAQLTALYTLGARKFLVSAVGPIGCIPDQLSKAGLPTCVSSTNDQIRDYNVGLQSMLKQLNNNLQGAQYLYGNVYDMVASMVANPGSHGLTVVNQGCCGGGLYRGQIPCLPQVPLCTNRDQYVFWDPYHPTEAANIVIARALMNGGPNDVSPINVGQMIGMH
ncbi:hypothetical protein MPTK1_7g05750 [Marchantia polymorpha subsp. ruderalis]|uniref:GDSL esterase/lipase n=2 Tax=Marchantia polymorpha TaxID=3197 RepID=A0A176WND4_MARPO|nr:hypothetical protein AXG93_1487s1250 [Marchantia polymorpha subsp. ruderalis]PTQ37479.1 hypothetical protein MARPO_0057s0096 [Marchantia polymorpha]BBN16378.1 hypothetical protein Mp_7g05750 [Marchantia polymorpha subsp. ruderalis]|eukprot:PTQ37479.1 hypothetical protein MARPO_0057s0096 [Marchantia polymorpha]